MEKEELAFLQSLEGMSVVRTELSDGTVINAPGSLRADRKRLSVFIEGKLVFQCGFDGLFCGRLLSGNGVRAQGFDRVTKKEMSLTLYFSY